MSQDELIYTILRWELSGMMPVQKLPFLHLKLKFWVPTSEPLS